MKEIVDNIWKYHWASPQHWVVVSTNGFVKRDGACVMGRGIALEAARKFKALPLVLGGRIKQGGNKVYPLPEYGIITFPVKHNWWEEADLRLIAQSAHELAQLFKPRPDTVVMPKVGCANGRRTWAEVKPLLEAAFEGWPNVVIVDRAAS